MKHQKIMKIGIVGAGVMGEHHIRVYSKLENDNHNIHIVGISDINKNRLKDISSKYMINNSNFKGYIKTYEDYEKMFENEIDGVSICVPTKLHYKVAISAIQHGIKYLLIEKPISDNVDEAKDIIMYAKDKGVKLLIGHVERFNPAVVELKKLVDSGRFGDILSISTRRMSKPPYDRDVGTGVIIDLAVHDFDVICYLYGDVPNEVYCIAGNGVYFKDNNHEDRAVISLKFSNNRSGIVETNWLTSHKIRTLDIVGTKSTAQLDYINQKIIISEDEKNEEIIFVKQEPLMKELIHFVDIMNGCNPVVSGNDGINSLRIAISAIKSCKSGTLVNCLPI